MNRERRADDETYPNMKEERASANKLPLIPLSASDALEMLGDISDGYGPEAEHAYGVVRELVTAAEEVVRAGMLFEKLPSWPEFERLRKSLEGKPA